MAKTLPRLWLVRAAVLLAQAVLIWGAFGATWGARAASQTFHPAITLGLVLAGFALGWLTVWRASMEERGRTLDLGIADVRLLVPIGVAAFGWLGQNGPDAQVVLGAALLAIGMFPGYLLRGLSSRAEASGT